MTDTFQPPEVLRLARYALGLSTQQVAAETKLGVTTISRLETDRGNPTRDTMQELTFFYRSRGVEFAPGGWIRISPTNVTKAPAP